MTLVVLERVTPSTRGYLTRWMLEIRAGVFVGTLSRRVREGLWEELQERRGLGPIMMVHRAANEQGFNILTAGKGSRRVVDFDGLTLLAKSSPTKDSQKKS